MDGAVGEPLVLRPSRDRQPAPRATAGGGSRAEEHPARAQRPLLTESDFENYDWTPFVRLIDELEERLPFVGVRYLVNKVLGPHNCNIDDPRIKRDLMNEAVDEGIIEMYTVGNVNERTDPVTACRLDRENELVSAILEEAEAEAAAEAAAEADAEDGADEANGNGVESDELSPAGA